VPVLQEGRQERPLRASVLDGLAEQALGKDLARLVVEPGPEFVVDRLRLGETHRVAVLRRRPRIRHSIAYLRTHRVNLRRPCRTDHQGGPGERRVPFPSRQHDSLHLSTRQYARVVNRWIRLFGGTPRSTAPIRCAARRTCGPCNSCLGAGSLKAPVDTLASRSMAHWKWPTHRVLIRQAG
jgi:hypothetical protein